MSQRQVGGKPGSSLAACAHSHSCSNQNPGAQHTCQHVAFFTGLDARAAAIVMRAVRNTVDTGRTVVCTIHQPSIDIFEVLYGAQNRLTLGFRQLCFREAAMHDGQPHPMPVLE
jgi:hypothetical protein